MKKLRARITNFFVAIVKIEHGESKVCMFDCLG